MCLLLRFAFAAGVCGARITGPRSSRLRTSTQGTSHVPLGAFNHGGLTLTGQSYTDRTTAADMPVAISVETFGRKLSRREARVPEPTCSAEPSAARKVIVTAKKNGTDEAEHAEISGLMRPNRATRAISAGRLQLESYQKL